MLDYDKMDDTELYFHDFFHKNHLKKAKILDMSENNQTENFKELLKYLSQKEVKIQDFALSIYKLYSNLDREDEVIDFVSLEDAKIKSSQYSPLVVKFLNDFLYTEEDKDIMISPKATRQELLEGIYALIEKRISGNLPCFYYDFSKTNKNLIMQSFESYLTNVKKYTIDSNINRLVFKNENKIESNAGISQEDLIEMYVNFIENVAIDFYKAKTFNRYVNANRNLDYEFGKVKFFKEVLESYMTEETKNLKIIKACMEKVAFLDDGYTIKEFKANSTYANSHGEYDVRVRKALKDPFKPENKEILEQFYNDLKKIQKALLPAEVDGALHPVNYFKIMETEPYLVRDLIYKIQKRISDERKEYMIKAKNAIKSGQEKRSLSSIMKEFKSQIANDETQEFLYSINTRLKFIFPDLRLNTNNEKPKRFEKRDDRVEEAVEYVVNAMHFNDIYLINNLSNESLKIIPSEVADVLRKENLPLSSTCIKEIFKEFFKGIKKENIVSLPKELQAENRENQDEGRDF